MPKGINMDREKDILVVASAVVSHSVNYWDNPNGPEEFTCPYCGVYGCRLGNDEWPDLKDMKHKLDCVYLIAKDLLTKR